MCRSLAVENNFSWDQDVRAHSIGLVDKDKCQDRNLWQARHGTH